MKEPKGKLDEQQIKDMRQTALLTYNYPLSGSGTSIPIPAHILYLLCKDWLKQKGVN